MEYLRVSKNSSFSRVRMCIFQSSDSAMHKIYQVTNVKQHTHMHSSEKLNA